MAKSKSKNEVEYLRGMLRQQKAQIRHLRKELQRLGYRFEEIQDTIDAEQEVEIEVKMPIRKLCVDCGKGTLKQEKLGARVLITCSACEYSKFEKPNDINS